ncbi:hypothetical protein SAMN05444143_10521 [Flavobacterium succinicans]|uniref:Uncharacterized protein n=1 Tax=Flavobacterium succinicans TaxID=29536 RepID=A0A1I4VJB8_9FLAO|nr:hypothetical protein [Flavobacterium succinicans]SFN01249.1 hypothetical protein SAMN05444143_10521 [Flavobacterium succinicans]
MNNRKTPHTFHIPVMGLAYTIDSPIRVGHLGISSVVSIADDELIEKMNAFYSEKFEIPYKEITQKIHDYRAKRITSYLNLVDGIVKKKFEDFKSELVESKQALDNYIAQLPNSSDVKKGFLELMDEGIAFKENLKNYIENQLNPGEIDVNIMTKLDKENSSNQELLPVEFNDAHAALRGFAQSNLESSVVLSAGMNPRLYSYFENFSCFFPDLNNKLKKKITLKVSDFRSAMIQGNFLAKKGLWVSEYRIESGLNCGGHAFATDGFLLGPILEEFKQKKEQLIQSAHDLMVKALGQKELPTPASPLELKITVQGGVGTADEHAFLLDHYQVDSVGWGSPFLLVPEATSVDQNTRDLLIKAQEKDFYLSHISPLGVPFNTLRGTSNEIVREKRIQANKAGSSCPKKFLALHKDANGNGICTASKKYQDQQLEALEEKKSSLSETHYQKSKNSITEKSCLCVGLANASYLENNIPIKGQDQGIVICPGPNLAYFDQEVSLKKMIQHIYGNDTVLRVTNRPNVFIKELKMYLDYFKNECAEATNEISAAQLKKLQAFKKNMLEGIEYYQNVLLNTNRFTAIARELEMQLNAFQKELLFIEVK